jgi:hypothetical protein
MTTAPVNVRTTHHLELDVDTREHIDRRMERQLKKLGRQAIRATVRFEDVNGPRGGVDTVCRVKLVLAGQTPIVSEARGSEPREAFDLAAAPAQRAALRALAAPRSRQRRGGAASTRPTVH